MSRNLILYFITGNEIIFEKLVILKIECDFIKLIIIESEINLIILAYVRRSDNTDN